MDGVRSLGGIFGAIPVGERNGGRNGNGDTFRQALEQQQQGGEGTAEADRADAEAPMRSPLQSRADAGRKKAGDGRHVDVFA